mmetsp:Transcript_100159/g.312064  ORF Transcript_100159/g.312064 Transcript_100159/m.312064 type:complete len:210 (-) Transcript_100159:871-1500(-)
MEKPRIAVRSGGTPLRTCCSRTRSETSSRASSSCASISPCSLKMSNQAGPRPTVLRVGAVGKISAASGSARESPCASDSSMGPDWCRPWSSTRRAVARRRGVRTRSGRDALAPQRSARWSSVDGHSIAEPALRQAAGASPGAGAAASGRAMCLRTWASTPGSRDLSAVVCSAVGASGRSRKSEQRLATKPPKASVGGRPAPAGSLGSAP